MTMIAIANYGDHIETMTDSVSYNRMVTELGPECSKFMAIPHMSAGVLSQGNSNFGSSVKSTVLRLSADVDTFDDVLETAPALMRALWPIAAEEAGGVKYLGDATGFLVGYSPLEDRFVAFGYASEEDFTPFRIEGLFVTPSPFFFRPSDLEFNRACPREPEELDVLKIWRQKPEPALPSGTQQWQDLAQLVREHRALEDFLQVIVAGRALHTRIDRGSIHTQAICAFADSGPEFLKMMGFTFHRTTQFMPCPCGSGEVHVNCHLAPLLSEPCECLSGREFWDCCLLPGDLDDNIEASERYWADEVTRERSAEAFTATVAEVLADAQAAQSTEDEPSTLVR